MKNSPLKALIILIALILAVSFVNTSSAQRKPKSQIHQPQAVAGPCPAVESEPVDAKTALAELEAGNKRWWQSKMEERNWSEEREEGRCGQHPFAVVLSCMDSRLPPELVFDQGLGDLFVIRVAGPVLNRDELASLEYALVHKKVKLVLVLGHTDCGAVRNAVDQVSGRYLPDLFEKIEPAITFVSDKYNGGVRITSGGIHTTPKEQKNLDRVSFVNARFVHSQILSKPVLRQPGVQVKWGLYYLANGKVAFDPTELEQ